MNAVFAAENLVKRYRSRVVVDGISFRMKSGEVVGLLGPNGAGKTTCFYMMVGLLPCDEGRVTLDDEDITRFPMDVRARKGIGYLPQEPSVFRKLSVADNILAILETVPGINKQQREQRLDEVLHELHISHLRDSLGSSLSGGERRRLEIARALAIKPRYILLDEPFAGVDPISVLDIQGIIKQLREQGIGVLITDHNVRETLGICDRAYIVNEGHIMAQGQPEEVLQNEQVRDVYLGRHFRL